MSAIAQIYLTGVNGSVTVDGISVPIMKWQAAHKVDKVDFTNSTSGGAQEVERGIESLNGSFDAVWKAVSGSPGFRPGNKYPVELFTKVGQSYTFTGYIEEISTEVTIKGEVKYTCKFDSSSSITVPA